MIRRLFDTIGLFLQVAYEQLVCRRFDNDKPNLATHIYRSLKDIIVAIFAIPYFIFIGIVNKIRHKY